MPVTLSFHYDVHSFHRFKMNIQMRKLTHPNHRWNGSVNRVVALGVRHRGGALPLAALYRVARVCVNSRIVK